MPFTTGKTARLASAPKFSSYTTSTGKNAASAELFCSSLRRASQYVLCMTAVEMRLAYTVAASQIATEAARVHARTRGGVGQHGVRKSCRRLLRNGLIQTSAVNLLWALDAEKTLNQSLTGNPPQGKFPCRKFPARLPLRRAAYARTAVADVCVLALRSRPADQPCGQSQGASQRQPAGGQRLLRRFEQEEEGPPGEVQF